MKTRLRAVAGFREPQRYRLYRFLRASDRHRFKLTAQLIDRQRTETESLPVSADQQAYAHVGCRQRHENFDLRARVRDVVFATDDMRNALNIVDNARQGMR